MENIEKLIKIIRDLDDERKTIEKAYSGNKARGVVLRKAMQDVKALAQNVREDISRIKNQ